MKNKSVYIALGLLLLSCESSVHEHNENSNASFEANRSKKADLPPNFLSKISTGKAISVIEARKKNKTGEKLIIEGAICGMLEPFTKDRAMFVLGDLTIKTCDKISGDNCPTPWDACCEDRKKIISSSLTVCVLDESGKIKEGTLKNVMGIEAGRKIKVEGLVDAQSIPTSMVINATRIELL